MPLVQPNGGCLDALARLVASWGTSLRIGLFQNDWTPTALSTIANVQPADFSGYNGLHQVLGWTTPTLVGNRAVSSATPRLWTRTVGNVSNWVFGYYVVNPAGALLWAERRPGNPQAVVVPGNEVRITPAYAVGSIY